MSIEQALESGIEEADLNQPTPEQYREQLRTRADRLGITYSGNISNEKLAARIEEHLAESGEAGAAKPVESVALSLPNFLRKKAEKLVRVMITCMNPTKRDYEGEIFTFSNDYISVTRSIPFNVATHIEQCLFDTIVEKRFNSYYKDKNKQTQAREVREYSVAVLDELSLEEIEKLKEEQRISRRIEEENL